MKYFLLILVIAAFFGGCHKKTTTVDHTIVVHDTVKPSWTEVQINGWDNSFVTSLSNNGELFVYGAQFGVYKLDSVSNNWSVNTSIYEPTAINKKPGLNKSIFFTTTSSGNFAVCSAFGNPWGSLSNALGNLAYFDTSFRSVPYSVISSLPFTNQIGINDSNKIVLPVLTSDCPKGCFMYINGMYNQSIQSYSISNVSKIKLLNQSSTPSSGSNISAIFNIKNNFVLRAYNSDSVYLIRPDHSHKALFKGTISSVFFFNNKHFLVLINNNGGDEIYQSNDLGENWALQYNSILPSGQQFLNLGDSIISVFKDKISLVSIKPFAIDFKLLKNDGLQNKQINGVNLLNGKVFVSTNAGLFSKPLSNFITNN